MLAMSGEHNRISQVPGVRKPKSIVEASDRLGITDLYLMVLRWRDGMRAVSRPRQRGEGEGFVAAVLLNAEKPAALAREQLVHRGLNVGAHVSGKLSRRRNQIIRGEACEMPLNGGASKVKSSCFLFRR